MAKLKEIEVSLGITIEVNGKYIKPNAKVVVELDESDTLEKRKKIWEAAWRTVDEQVVEKVQEFVGGK